MAERCLPGGLLQNGLGGSTSLPPARQLVQHRVDVLAAHVARRDPRHCEDLAHLIELTDNQLAIHSIYDEIFQVAHGLQLQRGQQVAVRQFLCDIARSDA